MSGELWLLAGGAAVAGLVQGISGFAFAMVAMSIWVWGVEPRLAAAMAVCGGLLGQVVGLFTVRRGLQGAVLAPFLAGALVGVPLGTWVLPLLDPARFKLVLGLCLLLCCPPMLLAHRLPRITGGGRWADGLVGLAGGVMGGIGGFSGMAPSLWVTLRGWDKHLQRGVIQNFSLVALAVTLVAYVATGAVRADMWPKFAVVAPAMLLPSLIGARIYHGLSPLAFSRVVLMVLTAAGLAMVAAGLPHL
ncbi:MAG: sulfite exporter TauE/SafE family protein [Burkholderiales bacterium]|nr:sulfite exporter TauE/SafE family protein [Burkholderiales bacterium]